MTPDPRRRTPPTELDELLSFIAAALAKHADLRTRNGGSVPPLALLVANWCADAARGCTEIQSLAPAARHGQGGDMAPLLLDLADCAALLRVSKRTVATMVKDGRLAVIRIGSAVRVRRSDIDALVAGRSATPRFLDRAEVKDTDAAGGAT